MVKTSFPVQRVQVQSLVEELRSHESPGQKKTKHKIESNITTHSIKTLKNGLLKQYCLQHKVKIKSKYTWNKNRHPIFTEGDLIKISVLPKEIYRFNSVLSQIPTVLFAEWKSIFSNSCRIAKGLK